MQVRMADGVDDLDVAAVAVSSGFLLMVAIKQAEKEKCVGEAMDTDSPSSWCVYHF